MRTSELLTDCLVDGDRAEVSRRRGTRRIAVLISLLLQMTLLTLLLLAPLFGRSEGLTMVNVTPIPPYKVPRAGVNKARPPDPGAQRPPHGDITRHGIYAPPRIPPTVYDGRVEAPPSYDSPLDTVPCPGCRPNEEGIIPIFGPGEKGGRPPEPPKPTEPKAKPRIQVSEPVQAALLIHRVEPRYPALARQIRREGTVYLRAIIGRDGRIGSLELISGDVILAQAAREAILQWRYQPTMLNGEPVEVETFITVKFILQQ